MQHLECELHRMQMQTIISQNLLMFRARSFSLRAPYLGGLVSHPTAVVARAGLPKRDFRLRLSVGWPLFLPAGRRWSALLARSILQSLAEAHGGCSRTFHTTPGRTRHAVSFARPRASPWSRSAGAPATSGGRCVGTELGYRWVQTLNHPLGSVPATEPATFKAQHVRALDG